MTTKRTLITVLAVLASLAGCGSDKGGGGDKFEGQPQPAAAPAPQWGSLYLQNEADLPGCEAARKGWLAYLVTPGEFRACDGEKWSVVDIKGKDGAAGKDGKDGDKGETGAQGAQGVAGAKGDKGDPGDDASHRVTAATFCSGQRTLTLDQFSFVVRITSFANGDRFVSCSVEEDSQVGVSGAGSAYYAAGTTGAEKAACAAAARLSQTGAGLDYFQFLLNNSNQYVAEATDANGTVIDTSGPLTCSTTTYP